MREQLFINGREIPLSKSLNPSLTRSIIDIRSPEKRSATYSKTVNVPNSKEAARVFEFIFEVNMDLTIFNPNFKADVLYLAGGEEVIRGYCQLKEIKQTNEHDIEYSIVMYSEFANLFKEIQNKWLDEITGLDTYNHILNKEIQNWSVNQEGVYQIIEGGAAVPAALGKGYVYPLVDYGFSTNAATFKTTDIGCSIFALEYWDRIFADAGYTYEFTDPDFEDHFKHLIIPSSPENFLLDEAEIAVREFSANTPILTSTGGTTSNNLPKGSYSAYDKIIFTNEISDVGSNYNNVTGLFTCTARGWYNFSTLIEVTATLTPAVGINVFSTGGVLFTAGIEYFDVSAGSTYFLEEDNFMLFKNGPGFGARTTNSPSTYPDPDYLKVYPPDYLPAPKLGATPNQLFLTSSNTFMDVGDTVRVVWSANYTTTSPNFFSDGSNYYNGDATIDISVGALFNKVANISGVEGTLLKVEKCIPKVKQTDFILNYVKEYNLYFDLDPDKTDHFLIAPRDSFYTKNIIDINSKVSIDKGIVYKPLGALDSKSYIYKHKNDSDYLNKRYLDAWQETYGQREITSYNEFNDKTTTTTVSASPTPLADNGTGNNRVLPTIIQVDSEGQKISTKSNWRTLYYGGQKSNNYQWKHDSVVFGFAFYDTYPYAGHFDDPFNPTLDINFGLVKQVYYSDLVEPITVTDNNLYNKYHSKFIREITDKDSKIVTCYVNLTPYDFKQWRFSDLYYFDNAYFRLNKIDGFNPTSNDLTKCEFLKLKNVSPFKPSLVEATGTGVPFRPRTEDGTGQSGGVDAVEYVSLKGITEGVKIDDNVYNSWAASVSGTGNIVSNTSYYVQITGNNNRVMGSSQNVNLINSNDNFVGSGLQNVTLINSDGLTITESKVTYIGGVKVNPPTVGMPTAVSEISSSQVSVSQDVETDVKTYVVDTSRGNVTLTFNLSNTFTEGQIWYFKKVSASNSLIISAGAGSIDGSATQTITGLNDEITVQYIGGVMFKIL
jgi:hypothetical protein